MSNELKRWQLRQEKTWQRLEALLDNTTGSISQLSPSEMRELGLMYRSTINDLSRARTLPEYQHLVPYLNSLVSRLHNRVYEEPTTRFVDVLRFFTHTFPRTVRANAGYIWAAFLIFVLGTGIAMATVHFDPTTEGFFLPPAVIDNLDKGRLWMDGESAAPSKASFLMTNNIKVAFYAYVLGITFGVGSVYILLQNGLFAFGGPLQVCIEHGMGQKLMMFVAPHGIIELTTIFIAGGAGLMIGLAMLFPGSVPRWHHVKNRSKDTLILVLGCAALLVVAGLIEGLISLNWGVPDDVRLAISAISAVILFPYLIFSGNTPLPNEAD